MRALTNPSPQSIYRSERIASATIFATTKSENCDLRKCSLAPHLVLSPNPLPIIPEIMLPDMFGIKLLEGMKKKDSSAAVIMVTGIAEEGLDIENLEKRCPVFCDKAH
jgi:DNA-binding response OmpR family regulator